MIENSIMVYVKRLKFKKKRNQKFKNKNKQLIYLNKYLIKEEEKIKMFYKQ